MTVPYKPKSNMISSYSIRGKDEDDYLQLKQMLINANVGVGEYLCYAYRELDKGYENHFSVRTIRSKK